MPEEIAAPKRTPKGEGDTVSLTIQLPNAIHAEMMAAAEAADRPLGKLVARALKDESTRSAVIEAGK